MRTSSRQSSPPRPVLAVVIPAYNVAPHITSVVSEIPAWIGHIIVVDDGSTDDTLDTARRIPDPRVRVIPRPTNGGVGAATKTGYLEALRLGLHVVIKMDGDHQMDPGHLPALVAPILRGQADYTKGNRFRDPEALRSMPALRRLGNLALSFLSKLVSGYWNIFDPTNGYTAIRREILAALPLSRVADRYFFEISMLVHLNLTNACVRDIPMPSRYGNENSSLRISHVLLSFPGKLLQAMVTRILKKYFLYDFNAVSLFLISGIPLFLLGTVLGVRYWSHSIATGVPTTAGQVMLAVFPLIIGFQLLLQAFVTDINAVPQVSVLGPIEEPPEYLVPEVVAGQKGGDALHALRRPVAH
jgi:dolichol-phosphate mannosyltransferase